MVDLDKMRREAETMHPDDVLAMMRELRALRELERVTRARWPTDTVATLGKALAAVDAARKEET